MGERTASRLIPVQVQAPYSVTVGADLLGEAAANIGERRVALVSDSNVAPLYAPLAEKALAKQGVDVTNHEVPAGEDSKSAERWLELQRSFARDRLDRGAAVVALGGGVVGDLAGFAAATYLRGLPWYQLPTSLLAMVDASVGGKTAINIREGKNLVGAFWQPKAVFADVRMLATLPDSEFRQGGVELFKHGLLADPQLLAYFDTGFGPDTAEAELVDTIARSVAVKAAIVAQDERESNVRAHLNLGHTLAHALEGVTSHALPHGDAVAYGLHYAALLGHSRGMADVTERTAGLLRWASPAPLPDEDFAELAPYLTRDKKNREGRQRMVLLENIGAPRVVDDITEKELDATWSALKEEIHR